jgi:hypothetical protein
MSKKIQPGDVFRFAYSNGYVYLQYLGVHPLMGESLLCVNGSANEIPDFVAGDGRVVFYPVKLNRKLGNVELVGSKPVAMQVPTSIRRPFVQNRKVQFWFLDEPSGTRRVAELAEIESQYPVGAVVSHEVLKEIQEGRKWFLFNE